MISRVDLENFRCFRDVKVRLGPLTVLVGPNASGKTALLQAIAGYGVGEWKDAWRHEAAIEVSLTWHGAAGNPAPFRFAFRHPGERDVLSGQPVVGQYLHLDVAKMRAAAHVQEANKLNPDGGTLTNVVATLPRRVQEQLVRDLTRLVPVIQDVTPRPSQAGLHRLVFQDRWNPDIWYEPNEVSDGTLLTLGLLSLQYQVGPVSVVAIEEPERGLHPYLLGEMVDILRKLANGEVGKRPLQIVLATQSAELLEFVRPDEVRFLNRRAEDGSVVVTESPTDSETWRDAYKAHQESLGSLWLSGGLGGVPTG